MTVDNMTATLERFDEIQIVETNEESIRFKTEEETRLRTKIVASLSRQNVIQSKISYKDGVWTVEIEPNNY